MNINEISVDTIQRLKNTAEKKRQEMEAQRRERDDKKEAEFLLKLKETSVMFIEKVADRAWAELKDCAAKGFLCKKFFFEDFKEKIGPVKVSTLVKGFHIDGGWDASIFQKIGMPQTPFETAVSRLLEKGILLEDVSDISKGSGCWLQVSFAPLN